MKYELTWISTCKVLKGAWLEAIPNLYGIVYLYKFQANTPLSMVYVAKHEIKKGQVVSGDDIRKLRVKD